MAWTIDPTHTTVGFAGRHLGISTVRGRFTRFSGEIELDGLDPTTARGRVEIDAASLDTGNEQRDAHLRSPDFFDVEKYPTIVFAPRVITPRGDDEYEVTGDLTIKDVTREAVLTYQHAGVVQDPWGGTRLGGSLSGSVNRTDWGLTWNLPLAAGGLVVSDKIRIEVEGELVQSPEMVATAA